MFSKLRNRGIAHFNPRYTFLLRDVPQIGHCYRHFCDCRIGFSGMCWFSTELLVNGVYFIDCPFQEGLGTYLLDGGVEHLYMDAFNDHTISLM